MPGTPIDIQKTANPPTDAWHALRQEVNRLFDRVDGGFHFPSLSRLFGAPVIAGPDVSFGFGVPAVDVSEDDESYKITAELPGLDENAVEVTLSGGKLILKGEKRQEKEETHKNFYVSERSYGAFQRSFTLPDGVDEGKITATTAKGVLTVVLPKTHEAQKQTKKIDVKAV
ncbi:Hsp20/alpha crystallin family protein [Nitrospirillum iridis]|uniref:HSP20 family protein n=1 Tax=Nitrospirillum iridis TaxID=765888 RepID=A0A7X0AZG9_9PROT|nr:Hsp20/alpha crystallin family protein [Nitrospirillum iridis]MBB6252978.1 HSP20 family protein [Nitrospirillum iridis]